MNKIGLVLLGSLGLASCSVWAGAHKAEGEGSGRFSDPKTWASGGVPTEEEDGYTLSLQPAKNGVVFVNDVGFTLSNASVSLAAPVGAVEPVTSIVLKGGRIELAPSSGNPFSASGRGGVPLTTWVDATLAAGLGGTYGTQIVTGEGGTTIFRGTLDHVLTSDAESSNFFYFYSPNGTNVVAGSYCQPDGVTWTKGPWVRSPVIITGRMILPGLQVQDTTLKIARGGRLVPMKGVTSSVYGAGTLDVCGGIFDHQRFNPDFQFGGTGATTLTVRDGGIARTHEKFRLGYGTGVTTVNILTGGVWSTAMSHYQGGAYRGAIHYEIAGGTAIVDGSLYLGEQSANTTAERTYLHLAAGQLRCSGITQEYSYNTAGRAKDVYIYPDGGELFVMDGNSTKSKTFASFLGGTVSHIRTQIRKGGFIINNHRCTVTYAGSIEGSDIAGEQDGGLVKRGGKNLTLSGECTYTGDNIVEDGTLVIAAKNAAANTRVWSVAKLQLNAPSYYAGGINLRTGAALVLNGAGDYSFDTLTAERDAIIRLSPKTTAIAAAEAISAAGNLLFDLTDDDAGAYPVLSAPNAAELAPKCRVLIASTGKRYSFIADGETVKLVIEDALYSKWTRSETGEWFDSENWTGGVPNAAGAQARLAGAPDSQPDLTVANPLTLGALRYASESTGTANARGWNLKPVTDATLTLTPTDATLPSICVDKKYNGLYLPVSAADSIVISILDGRLYSDAVIASSDPDAHLVFANAGVNFVSTPISLPSYFLPDAGVLYGNKALAQMFANGVSFGVGTGVFIYDNMTISGPSWMSETTSIAYGAANKTLTLHKPIGYLGAILGTGTHGTLVVEDFSGVTHYLGNTGTTVYRGTADVEMPRMTLATANSAAERHIDLQRAANAGDVTIDGRNLVWDIGGPLNAVSLRGDATGFFRLGGVFTYPARDSGARLELGAGNYELKDDFLFCSLLDGASEVAIGSNGTTTEVAFNGDALVDVQTVTMEGVATLDMTSGGMLIAADVSFSGTLCPRVATLASDEAAIRVGTARFAAGGTIDFKRTTSDPLPKKGRIALLKFDILSAEDEANLKTWTITGCGYEMREPSLLIDRTAGEVCLTSRSTAGIVLIVR